MLRFTVAYLSTTDKKIRYYMRLRTDPVAVVSYASRKSSATRSNVRSDANVRIESGS
ncbi:hypothetical protein HSR122_0660 [Halapricum desulfuricans]|uniref:Uncharacterized protein n=1 Tax=Halapricum desulfuricans TaxID=2841257 RepID=A0A897NCD4_9EURY|nr:hypothetical protein HSR122_0660 [Halapricum desulfuricans]